MSNKAIKRRVRTAIQQQKQLVILVDRCDDMIEDMTRMNYEPSDVQVFRDRVLDYLHGAEEELFDACTTATLAGIKVQVRTRKPLSLMRAEYQLEQAGPEEQ